MVFVNNVLHVLYIHIPKCGGSYIKNIICKNYDFSELTNNYHNTYKDFFNNENNINLDEDTDKHTIRKMGKLRYFYSHQDVINKNIFNDYFSFTFVRNPYNKIYSAYLYLKRNLEESKYNNKIRNTYENKEYFVDFNTFVKNYTNVNNISYYHSFITQYDHLVDFSNNIKISYIGRVENLDNDFIDILTLLGIKDITHIDKIVYNKRENDSGIKDNYSIFYNEESFQFVNTYFEKDFEIFGYTKYNSLEDFQINSHVKNNSYNNFNLYKEIQLNKYNQYLQEQLIVKYQDILRLLICNISVLKNSFLEEVKIIKDSIKLLNEEKITIFSSNNEKLSSLNDIIFENNIHKLLNQRLKCEKCNFLLYNKLAKEAHSILC